MVFGLLLFSTGLYLLLNAIHATDSFTLGYGLFHRALPGQRLAGYTMTRRMIFMPMVGGIGLMLRSLRRGSV